MGKYVVPWPSLPSVAYWHLMGHSAGTDIGARPTSTSGTDIGSVLDRMYGAFQAILREVKMMCQNFPILSVWKSFSYYLYVQLNLFWH